jgi:hypothetical protein
MFLFAIKKNLIYFIIIMEYKCVRKYNTVFRKRLINRFEKIKDKTDYIIIYNIIIKDIGNNFSSNRNGIFINMNILSDNCIDKILEFINDKLNITNIYSDSEKINYKVYKFDEGELITDRIHKLSNHEKSIIKRIRNKTLN